MGKLLGTATVGGNMRRERTARGLTLETVGERLGLKRPAPLSTFERSKHVPKAETIKEYAVAIGCAPADLLAGVVTEYDALRGALAPSPAQFPIAPTLTRLESQVLKQLREMNETGQRLSRQSIAGYAKAFPLQPSQAQHAQPSQNREAKERRARGTR